MSSQTTICAKRVCANAGRMNELKLEQSVNSFGDSSTTQALQQAVATAHVPLLSLTNTHNGTENGPVLRLNNMQSDAIALNDSMGLIQFNGQDTNASGGVAKQLEYASINGLAHEVTDGSEEGKLEFNCASAGDRTTCMTITGGATDATDSIVTIPGILTGHKFQTETVVAATDPAPSAAESGKAFIVPTIAATTITLPAVAAGLTFRVLFSASPSGNITLDCAGGAIFQGIVIGDANAASPAKVSDKNTLIFSASTAVGDSVDILCDGTNWHVRAYVAAHGTVTFS